MNDKELSEIRARHDAMNGQHGVPVAMSHTTAYNRANADRATLLSHIDTLTAERDEFEGRYRTMFDSRWSLEQSWNDLRAQLEALTPYLQHKESCELMHGTDVPAAADFAQMFGCTCGLSELLVSHKEQSDG